METSEISIRWENESGFICSEEIKETSVVVLKKEAHSERMKQIAHIQDVIASKEYNDTISTCGKEFEEKRKEFLGLLETQPGFLQSSFLSLHRKLCQKYK